MPAPSLPRYRSAGSPIGRMFLEVEKKREWWRLGNLRFHVEHLVNWKHRQVVIVESYEWKHRKRKQMCIGITWAMRIPDSLPSKQAVRLESARSWAIDATAKRSQGIESSLAADDEGFAKLPVFYRHFTIIIRHICLYGAGRTYSSDATRGLPFSYKCPPGMDGHAGRPWYAFPPHKAIATYLHSHFLYRR